MKMVFCVLMGLILSACGHSAVPAKDSAGFGSAAVSPSDVVFETIKMDYVLPKQVREVCVETGQDGYVEEGIACPVVEIELAKSTPDFIARVVNEVITGDNSADLVKFRRRLDEFVQEQIDNGTHTSHKTVAITRLPDYNQLVQIAIDDNVYAGGMHDNTTLMQLLFDMNLQSQIGLDDIVVARDEFWELLESAYDQQLMYSQMYSTIDEINSHKQSFPLYLTDKVYFDEDGMVLLYEPYELGPYVMGAMPLKVYFDDLWGVIRPEYLPRYD